MQGTADGTPYKRKKRQKGLKIVLLKSVFLQKSPKLLILIEMETMIATSPLTKSVLALTITFPK